MARINLLPWRESVRQTQKNQYVAALAGIALLIMGISWAIGEVIEMQIRNQESRNLYLTQQITILDQQIKEIQELKDKIDAITMRMALIEQLQVSRNLTAMVFEELAIAVPNGIALDAITRQEDSITIVGVSESNNRLSSFMRAIDSSNLFDQPELSSIVSDLSLNSAVSDFKLSMKISPDFTSLETGQQ